METQPGSFSLDTTTGRSWRSLWTGSGTTDLHFTLHPFHFVWHRCSVKETYTQKQHFLREVVPVNTLQIRPWFLWDTAKAFWETVYIIIRVTLKGKKCYSVNWASHEGRSFKFHSQACCEHWHLVFYSTLKPSVQSASSLRDNQRQRYLREPFGIPGFRPWESAVLNLLQQATSQCGGHECDHHVGCW